MDFFPVERTFSWTPKRESHPEIFYRNCFAKSSKTPRKKSGGGVSVVKFRVEGLQFHLN